MRIGVAIRRLKVEGPKERDCLALAGGLAARGHEVVLLTTEPGLTVPSGVRLVTGGASAAIDQEAPVLFAAWLADLLRRRAFDSILSFEKGPADFYFASDSCFAARTTGLRRWIPGNRQLAKLERSIFEEGSGAHIFFPSESQRRDYQAHYTLRPDRFTILPPIVAVPPGSAGGFYASRDRVRANLGVAEQTVMAIHVATAPFEKGTDRVIAAIAEFPAIHLLVVGDRRAEHQRRQAQDLECLDRIWFLDQSEDLAAVLGAADLMLHPARTEVTGRIFLDSLLAGVPVVTLADCALSEQISQHSAGIVMPAPFDAKAFSSLIGALLLPSRLEVVRRNARRASVLLTNAGLAPALGLVERAIGARFSLQSA